MGDASQGLDAAPSIDPLELNLAGVPLGPAGAATGVAPGGGAPAGAPLDLAVANEIVRRLSWGGDRRRGVARIELAGGGVITVTGEGREVTLDVTLPKGEGDHDLARRLTQRLEARGLEVRDIVIR